MRKAKKLTAKKSETKRKAEVLKILFKYEQKQRWQNYIECRSTRSTRKAEKIRIVIKSCGEDYILTMNDFHVSTFFSFIFLGFSFFSFGRISHCKSRSGVLTSQMLLLLCYIIEWCRRTRVCQNDGFLNGIKMNDEKFDRKKAPNSAKTIEDFLQYFTSFRRQNRVLFTVFFTFNFIHSTVDYLHIGFVMTCLLPSIDSPVVIGACEATAK